MNNIYAITFDPTGFQRDELLALLESEKSVVDYHASVPDNLILVVSAQGADRVTTLLRESGRAGMMLVTRLHPNDVGPELFGFMPEMVWDFIRRYDPIFAVTPIDASIGRQSARAIAGSPLHEVAGAST